jgi:hypothetical protein
MDVVIEARPRVVDYFPDDLLAAMPILRANRIGITPRILFEDVGVFSLHRA